MLFSSTFFLFAFLPIVLSLYFLLPGLRARNALLLLASLVFYAWGDTIYVFLLLSCIGLNFALGRLIGSGPNRRSERGVLALAVGLNLGLLSVFKYANFIVDNLDWLFAFFSLRGADSKMKHHLRLTKSIG